LPTGRKLNSVEIATALLPNSSEVIEPGRQQRYSSKHYSSFSACIVWYWISSLYPVHASTTIIIHHYDTSHRILYYHSHIMPHSPIRKNIFAATDTHNVIHTPYDLYHPYTIHEPIHQTASATSVDISHLRRSALTSALLIVT